MKCVEIRSQQGRAARKAVGLHVFGSVDCVGWLADSCLLEQSSRCPVEVCISGLPSFNTFLERSRERELELATRWMVMESRLFASSSVLWLQH